MMLDVEGLLDVRSKAPCLFSVLFSYMYVQVPNQFATLNIDHGLSLFNDFKF